MELWIEHVLPWPLGTTEVGRSFHISGALAGGRALSGSIVKAKSHSCLEHVTTHDSTRF